MRASGILSAASLFVMFALLPACHKDSGSSSGPAPVKPKPQEKTTEKVDATKRELAESEDKRIEAEKKLAEAQAALEKAKQEGAGQEAIDALTHERDAAKAKVEALIEIQKRVAEPFQGNWLDSLTLSGRECEVFLRVEGTGFQKIVSCSTETDTAFLNQYESGSLTNIGSDKQGRVLADFTVEKTSCRWGVSGKTHLVAYPSQSGTLADVTVSGEGLLTYLHPAWQNEQMFFQRAPDACNDATGLRARVCSFLEARGENIEPDSQLGCFVRDEGESFRHTGLISDFPVP
jgi:hypothetical protein